MHDESVLVTDMTHPSYDGSISEWAKYRLTAEGGSEFIEKYLQKFSKREDNVDFQNRMTLTYAPSHAKAAILGIKNAIYQRMAAVSRTGGPASYQKALSGDVAGVDLTGNSMNGFFGRTVLPELLFLGKVGIFVDKPVQEDGASLADTKKIRPYLYHYRAEDIRSWYWDDNYTLRSLLLRDHDYVVDQDTMLVTDRIERFRLLNLIENRVRVRMYNSDGELESEWWLNISAIPFCILELNQSLLTDIADYQIALLNLGSSDMNYAMKSNFPFYTEQYLPSAELFTRSSQDTSSVLHTPLSGTLPEAGDEGTRALEQVSNRQSVTHGVMDGRRYPKGVDKPAFINPDPAPLMVSMQKQQRLVEEIRELAGLNLASLQSRRASAESKKEDGRGKEEGLSNIGLELEYGERRIAAIWSMYEGGGESATVQYPQTYSLRSDSDRRTEATELIELGSKLPSKSFQQQIAKQAAKVTVGPKIPTEDLETIYKEIDDAKIIFTDSGTLIADLKAGLVSVATASKARGYPDGEVEAAKKDHAARLALISQAQMSIADRGDNDKEPDDDDPKEPKDPSDPKDLNKPTDKDE